MNDAFLDNPIYSVVSAADILDVSPSTLWRWLDGDPDSKTSLPVIRPESTGSKEVTWGEFVEAAFLCQYRRRGKIPLREIRKFVTKLRETKGVLYPLASRQPWVGAGRHLLLELQKSSNLPEKLWLIAITTEQLVLAPAAEAFYERLDWKGDLAVAWRPHAEEKSPVRCRPTHRFGRPSIKGISTEAIFGHVDGGESAKDVAEQFDLQEDEVRWACSYEQSRLARKAA